MAFIQPMLAEKMEDTMKIEPGIWAADEKLDGHRLVVEVTGKPMDLFSPRTVQGWSRDGLIRVLPSQIVEAMVKFPVGIYDGELLVPGKRSYGVTDLRFTKSLIYAIFDILQLMDQDTMDLSYDDRRSLLEEMFARKELRHPAAVLVPSCHINSRADLDKVLKEIWARDGEGVILKRRSAIYRPNKRSKDFLKIKQLNHGVATVIGFIQSTGKIQDRGPYGIVLLEDDKGIKLRVKTKNDAQCRTFEADATRVGILNRHPAIGRRLCFDYHERTPRGEYREPRWDRWEDE